MKVRQTVSAAGRSLMLSRRNFLAAAGATALTMTSGRTFAAEPVTLSILDVAGNLKLTGPMIDSYIKANPGKLRRYVSAAATEPDLVGKISSQQKANNLQIDLVLTGTGGVAAGIEFGLWEPTAEMYERTGAKLENLLLPAAYDMQKLARGQAVVLEYTPAGPLMLCDPQRVPAPPKTPQQLLDWARANPGKFMYARPGNSGPGRALLMGLPYLLKDSNPFDPEKGWTNTWAYLEQLGNFIDYYPPGTAQTMTELGQGTRAIVAGTTGFYMNARALGIIRETVKPAVFDNATWVSDAHYFAVPKGVPPEKMSVLLDLLAWMHKPAVNAMTYDEGYFYPGPAVKGVELSMAPKESQEVINKFRNADVDAAIKNYPVKPQLDFVALQKAFATWDRRIGGSRIKAK